MCTKTKFCPHTQDKYNRTTEGGLSDQITICIPAIYTRSLHGVFSGGITKLTRCNHVRTEPFRTIQSGLDQCLSTANHVN